MNTPLSIPERVKQVVQSIDPNATVILFGSRARGDFHEESDWDFLVLLDILDFSKKKLLLNEVYNIELEVEQAISLVFEERKEWQKLLFSLFYENVQKDGIILN